MEVPVRELKAQLSSYLKRAAAGEIITVTDRGRPVATLGPTLQPIDLTRGIEAGWIQSPSRAGLRAVRRARARSTVADVLAEDRSE